MDSETKQELLTIALLMKKARMQGEVDRKEEMDNVLQEDKMEEENCFVNEEEQRLEMQDEADRLVRQQLSFGFSKFEDMVRHVAMKQPDEYKRLKPLLRKTWNFWCRDPEEEIACERGKEICFKIEEEIEKSALEQRQKTYDMTTQRGRLLAAIEGCIVNVDEFGYAEQLLLAIWLLNVDEVDAHISYDSCQSRTAIRFTYDQDKGFVKGIYWDYDFENDVLGDVSATILDNEFTHQAVWGRYSDLWYDEKWLVDGDEVCEELNDALNSRVHEGNCDYLVLDEEPYIDEFIIRSALRNTEKENRFYYILVDQENHVYFAKDKKLDEDEHEWCWMVESGIFFTTRVPIGKLHEISEEECVQLLLQQKLIVSQEFGDDALWEPVSKKMTVVSQ